MDLTQDVVEREGQLALHRLGVPEGLSTLRSKGRSYFDFNKRALRYAAGLERPDLLFASSPPLTVILPAIRLSARQGTPLLFEVRDLWPAFLVEGGLLKPGPVAWAMEWIEYFCLAFADHVVSVAPAFTTYLERVGVPPAKLSTVPTGGDPVYLGKDRSQGAKWRAARGLEGRFIALFTGSFNENNGIETLLEAAELTARRNPQVAWVFAGGGRLKGLVEAAAARLPNVRYLGALPRDAMAPLYFAADVGLLPRAPWPMQETVLPGKLFDYLASGLPVLCMAKGQPGLMVESSGAGTVLQERSAPAMADAVLAMAALPPEKRAQLGAAGQRWVLQQMNAYRMGEELLAVAERPWPRRTALQGTLRVLSSALAATWMLLLRRSSRPVRELSGEGRHALIAGAFQRWLHRPGAGERVALDHRLPMPRLLSSREQ